MSPGQQVVKLTAEMFKATILWGFKVCKWIIIGLIMAVKGIAKLFKKKTKTEE